MKKRILLLITLTIVLATGLAIQANADTVSVANPINAKAKYKPLNISNTTLPHIKSNFSFEQPIGTQYMDATTVQPVTIDNDLTLKQNPSFKIRNDSKRNWKIVLDNKPYFVSKDILKSDSFTTVNTRYLVGNASEIISNYAPDNAKAIVPAMFELSNGTQWVQMDHNKPINGFVYIAKDHDWEKLTLINKAI